ncbi:MAG: transpeptidase family protein [Acidobacteria bacterium]|nr:transpeptidase family protein [Acidobacteriota bacterium]
MRPAPAASRTRLVFLAAVTCLWLGLILVRLVDLQVVRHPELARRAQRQQQRTLEITPQRGVLYDRNGRELAVSIGVDSVFAVPSEVTDPALAARLLAPVLNLEPTVLEDRLRSERSFVWVQRKLDAATAARVRALNLAGIYSQREHKRFYPKRQLAAHVLGFVGLDEQGLGGIEYSLDELIRGRPRRLIITADGRRRRFERSDQVAREGSSVVLTLDENIQYIAERELAAVIARTRAASGTLIVADPRTGEILALANYPSFNPNEPTALPADWRINRAITLAYEPGSTFKVVTVAAALAEGLTRPQEVVDCQQGSIVLAGHRIRDHKPFGPLSVRQVIYESSDVGAIKLALRVGDDKMSEHIRRWRFGRPTGVELPAESPGLLRPASRWSRISIGAIAMGQEVAVTPLQLTAAISAIANGGVWVQPRVVREILRGNQRESLPSSPSERIIPVGVAEELRRMLAGVVAQGTGREAQPAGYSAAGKTGTAEKIDASGTYSRTDFIASFVGFAPIHDPAVTVVVVLDSPRGPLYHGGEVAAPVFRAVTERVLAYLNVPRDLPVAPDRSRLRAERAAVQDFQPGRFEPASWLEEDMKPVPALARRAASREEESAAATFASHRTSLRAGSIVLMNGDSVAVPDLAGLSLREAVERCARLGLEPVLAGSGVAVAQSPAPGTRLPRGSRVWVEFRAALPAALTRPM